MPTYSPNTSRLKRWLKKSLLGLGLLILALAVLGTTYQALGAWFDWQAFPPPGEMIDVGDYRLHLYCQGEGKPTVILESGLSATVAMWARIQAGLAETTQVCAYDRAGIGWSEAASRQADARQVVDQLHGLLQKADVQAPYVLVGHSMGGLFARAYTAAFPQQVVGLVLLDAAHPDQGQRLPEEAQAQQGKFIQLLQWAPTLARLGVLRVASWFTSVAEELPDQAQAAHEALLITAKHLQATLNEAEQWDKTTAQVRQNAIPNAIPLLVMSAGTDEFGFGPEGKAQWQALQRDLAHLSENSVYRHLPQATHHSLLTQPDHAAITIAAIKDIILQTRAQASTITTDRQ